MKAASPALIALLNSTTQFVMADLYTFTLVGGSVLRYSAASTPIVANGFTFGLGPKFERSKTNTVIGTQVDVLDIKIYTETTDLIGETPWLQAAWQGQLDGLVRGVAGPGRGRRYTESRCPRPGLDGPAPRGRPYHWAAGAKCGSSRKRSLPIAIYTIGDHSSRGPQDRRPHSN